MTMLEEGTLDRELEKILQVAGVPQDQIDEVTRNMRKHGVMPDGVRVKMVSGRKISAGSVFTTRRQRIAHALFGTHRSVNFGGWNEPMGRFIYKEICGICEKDL